MAKLQQISNLMYIIQLYDIWVKEKHIQSAANIIINSEMVELVKSTKCLVTCIIFD